MTTDDLDIPREPEPAMRPLEPLDLYEALTPLAPDPTIEADRLKREMLALVTKHRDSIEAMRVLAENLNEQLSSARTQSRRALGKLVQVVKALRALCRHLENQPLTSLTYFGGEQFAAAFRQAAEVLKLCEGVE